VRPARSPRPAGVDQSGKPAVSAACAGCPRENFLVGVFLTNSFRPSARSRNVPAVSDETSSPAIDPHALSEPLARLTASHDELARFLAEVFGQLGELAGELARRQECWDSERCRHDASLQQRQQQLQSEREELDDRWKKLETRSREVRHEAAASDQGESRIAEMVTEVSQQRSEMLTALEQTRNQFGQLTEISQQLAAAREELSQTRQDIRRQQEQLAALSATASPQASGEASSHALDFQRERSAWEQERAVLETELDSIRNRAADLAQTLEAERRQLAEQRSQWTEELKQMRRMLEELRRQPTAGPGPVEAAAQQAPAEASPPEPSQGKPANEENDPVLDSVMAQFEMLQKDLARRRKAEAVSD